MLMHGALAPGAMGVEAWPRVPVEVHYAEGDTWVDVDDVRALEGAVRASGAPFAAHVYAEGGHLFADDASPDYAPRSAELMLKRMLAFLEST